MPSARPQEGGTSVQFDARQRASSLALLLLLCVLWYTSSALTSNTSKDLLSRRRAPGQEVRGPPVFPYPVTLTLVQFVFVHLYCYLGTRRALLGEWVLAKRLVRVTWPQLRDILQISVFNVVGHALGTLAVSRVEVSLVHRSRRSRRSLRCCRTRCCFASRTRHAPTSPSCRSCSV